MPRNFHQFVKQLKSWEKDTRSLSSSSNNNKIHQLTFSCYLNESWAIDYRPFQAGTGQTGSLPSQSFQPSEKDSQESRETKDEIKKRIVFTGQGTGALD